MVKSPNSLSQDLQKRSSTSPLQIATVKGNFGNKELPPPLLQTCLLNSVIDPEKEHTLHPRHYLLTPRGTDSKVSPTGQPQGIKKEIVIVS